MALTYIERLRAAAETVERQLAEKIETKPKISPRKETAILSDEALKEYREVAAAVGVSAADLMVEEFRNFLTRKDIPVFNLQEVIKYMDDIAAKDNPTGLGWHWCPVRNKDTNFPMTFGRASVQNYGRGTITAASDFYESHLFRSHFAQHVSMQQAAMGGQLYTPPSPIDYRTNRSPAYTRTIPLHALKKIAMIEKEFTPGGVCFLVTDYTVSPDVIINPDPFLMAVIPNSAVSHGKGRFVIDVWDEPGFGLDKMLIPAK